MHWKPCNFRTVFLLKYCLTGPHHCRGTNLKTKSLEDSSAKSALSGSEPWLTQFAKEGGIQSSVFLQAF